MALWWALSVVAVFAQEDEPDENGWKSTVNDQGQRVQQMQVMAPSLTEQDQKDARLPEQYRCDACMAVGHHLKERLKKHKITLSSWEYIDLFEETCKEASFPGYGVKLHDGVNKLSGAGILRDETLQPGGASIQMGGESWSRRLASECKEIVFDIVGEDEVYKLRKASDFGGALCGKAGYCDADGLKDAVEGRKAAKAAKKREEEKKKKEKEEKKAEKQRKIDMGEETEEEEEEREAKEAKKRKEKAQKEKEERKKAEEAKKKAEEAEERKKQKEAAKAKLDGKLSVSAQAKAAMSGKLTWEEYAESLVDRGYLASSVLKSPRTAKDWDLQLLSLSSKISAEALAKTEM